MRWKIYLTMMTLFCAGCVNEAVVSKDVMCDRTTGVRATHASALAFDGGPMSIKTGAALIAAIDAGCGQTVVFGGGR